MKKKKRDERRYKISFNRVSDRVVMWLTVG